MARLIPIGVGAAVFALIVALLWPLAATGFPIALTFLLLTLIALFGVFTVSAEAQAEADARARAAEDAQAFAGEVEGVA